MKYRKDIDGLRCLAVMPVLLFHAGFSLFSGGYVGVDIFFVISGFLISQILLQELQEQRFSIVQFYQRRARRILPALFMVIWLTAIAAGLIIPPELFKEFGQSLVSVGVFASNFFFYAETGYFGFAAEKMPLLHTWSLAVEEQFYIFTPPLLFLLYRLGIPLLGVVLLGLSLLSLAWSQYLLAAHQQGHSFFLILPRAWELFAGSLVAIYQLDKKTVATAQAQWLSLAGFALIMVAIFGYQRDTLFPGLHALVPVLGTVLLISFSRPGTWVHQLLSLKPLVWIGLISYSLYLVHQPVFALCRFLFIQEPSSVLFAGLIAVSIVLAYVNYRYVERPFRQVERFSGRFMLTLGAVGCVLTVAIGLVIHLSKGLPQRYGDVPYADSVQPSPKRHQCHSEGGSVPLDKACHLNGQQPSNWVVLADSHGVELSFELAKRLQPLHIGLTQYTLSSCPPALLHRLKMPMCSDWQAQAVERLSRDPSVSTVVLIYRATAFIAGRDIKHYPQAPDEDRSSEFEFGEDNVSKAQSYQLYWQNYQHLVQQLLAAGKRVIFIDPLPELPLDVRQLIYPRDLLTGSYHLSLSQTTSVELYHQRHQFILQHLATLPAHPRFYRFSPLPIFCDSRYCAAVRGDKSLYFDDNHPSLYGAGLLADALLAQFPANP